MCGTDRPTRGRRVLDATGRSDRGQRCRWGGGVMSAESVWSSGSFAIGVLRVDPGCDDEVRREARLRLALRAHELGHFLLDVVEVSGAGSDPGYATAERLAARADADAFVIGGEVDLPRLRGAADRVRMTIKRAAAP